MVKERVTRQKLVLLEPRTQVLTKKLEEKKGRGEITSLRRKEVEESNSKSMEFS